MVSPEFWKFIVVLTPLVLGTFVVVLVIQNLWTKKHDVELAEMRKTSGLAASRGRTTHRNWRNCWGL